METTLATQGYIFSPDDLIYHLARNRCMSVCGRSLHGKSEERRRRDDLRLSAEKPIGQFTMLCSECDRHVTGEEKPEPPSPELIPHYPP